MPLSPGSDRATISRNISEMVHSGHPQAQAVAASLSNARRHPRAAGGRSLVGMAGYGEYGTHQPDMDPQDFWAHLQTEAPYQRWHEPADDTEVDQIGKELSAGSTRPDVRKPHIAGGGPIDKALHAAKGYAFGGISPPPYFARVEAREMDAPDAGGVINSEVPGRTDHLPASPLTGSYILPAETISGLGEGNTLAGARIVEEMLNTGPWGTKYQRVQHRDTIPRPPRPLPEQAKGGDVREGDTEDRVPILAAGGEFIIPPHTVMHHPLLGNLPMGVTDQKLKNLALKRGHSILDAFVRENHKQHAKVLASLPGPSK